MNKKKFPGLATGLICTAFGVVLYFFLYHFSIVSDGAALLLTVLRPLFIGIVIAYILRKPCGGIQKVLSEKFPKCLRFLAVPIALIMGFLLLFLIVAALLWFVIPALSESIVGLIETFPAKFSYALDYLERWVNTNVPYIELDGELGTYLETYLDTWFDSISDSLMPFIYGIGESAVNIVKILIDVLIGLIVALYLLASRAKFKRQFGLLFKSVLGEEKYDSFIREVHFADRAFTGFVNGKILDSLIVGIICFVACLIIRIPSPMLISVIIGVTNIIPIFGPFIGAVPTTVIILASDPFKALIFVFLVLAIQLFDGYVMGPKILGSSIRISGFWVLIAVTIGGGLFGVAGMILGVPIFAVIYDIITKISKRRLVRMGVLDAREEALKMEKAEAEALNRKSLIDYIKMIFDSIVRFCKYMAPKILKGLKAIGRFLKKAGIAVGKAFMLLVKVLGRFLKKTGLLIGKLVKTGAGKIRSLMKKEN